MARRPLAALALTGALAATAGCGSSSLPVGGTAGPTAPSVPGTPSATGSGPVRDLAVAVTPAVDCAPAFLGEAKGFFRDEGLNVTLTPVAGGAAAVTGVVSGSFDVGFGNPVSVMVASDKGLPLRYVSNGASTSGQRPDFGAVVVPAGSPIRTPAQLAGKKVSVNAVSSIGDTTIRKVVEDAGGRPESMTFVEVAFADAAAALSAKQVDAAWLVDPFLRSSVAGGARIVTNNYVDVDPALDVAGYFARPQTFTTDKEALAAFQRGMSKSLDYANSHPAEVRDVVGTYTQIDADARAAMVLPRFTPRFDRPALQKLADAAVRFGTVSRPVDLDAMLPPR